MESRLQRYRRSPASCPKPCRPSCTGRPRCSGRRGERDRRPRALTEADWGAALSGLCFDSACEEARNQIYLASIGSPLLLLSLGLGLAWRRAGSANERDRAGIDSGGGLDDTNGVDIDGQEDYESDLFGLDGFRVLKVEKSVAERGFRVKCDVGPVGRAPQPKSFHFSPTLGDSLVFKTTLSHPIGLTFAETKDGRVVISQIAKGTDAYRQASVARLSGAGGPGGDPAPRVGDVLRAFSSISFFYSQGAIFGLKPPARTKVLFGVTDRRKWSEVSAALSRTRVSDGSVTVVLERRIMEDE